MNVGEELAAEYLQYILGCEFIQKNLQTGVKQGEIDVVGINLKTKTVYLCEVAIHIQGLLYVNQKTNTSNNVPKLVDKFTKDIEYARKFFPDYEHIIMLWSPVVKNSQLRDVQEIQEIIFNKFAITIKAMINDTFAHALEELGEYARKTSSEIKTPITRFLQIKEWLNKHLG